MKGSSVVQLCGRQSMDGLTQFAHVIAPVTCLPTGVVVGQHSTWVILLLLLLLMMMIMTLMREIARRRYNDDDQQCCRDEEQRHQTSACFTHRHSGDAQLDLYIILTLYKKMQRMLRLPTLRCTITTVIRSRSRPQNLVRTPSECSLYRPICTRRLCNTATCQACVQDT